MKQIELEWAGESFTVRERDAFDLASELEDVISLMDLQSMAERPKFTILSKALATTINFCGGHVTASEVHREMMKEVKAGEDEKTMLAVTSIQMLIEILMDGAPEGDGESDSGGKSSSSKAAT